jgi:hypothetical protein
MSDQQLQKFVNSQVSNQYEASNSLYDEQIKQYNDQLKWAEQNSQDWAGQIQDTFNRGTQDVNAAYAAAAQNMAQTQDGIAGLFGEAQAPDVAVYGQPGKDLLAAQQASDASFASNMQGVFNAQQQDYARRARSDILTKMAEAMAQRQSSMAQMRSQQSGGLLDAYEARDKALAGQRALWQAEQMMPFEQSTAYANAQSALANANAARVEAKNAPAVAAARLRQAQADLQNTVLEGQIKLQELANGSTRVNMNDAATVEALKTGIRKSFAGARGGLVLRPDIAYENALASLATVPGIDMNIARRLAAIEVQKALNISHSVNNWLAWTWKNGRPVLNKAKAAALAEARQNK